MQTLSVMRDQTIRVFLLISLALSLLGQCHHQGATAAAESPRGLSYQLHSLASGRLVTVLRGGRVHAHAASNNRNTRFLITNYYNKTADSFIATFQSVKFRGRYLVMDEEKNKLLLRRPRGNFKGSEKFEVLKPSPIDITLRDRRGCYVGFSSAGEQLDPCTLSPERPETRLTITPFEFDRGH